MYTRKQTLIATGRKVRPAIGLTLLLMLCAFGCRSAPSYSPTHVVTEVILCVHPDQMQEIYTFYHDVVGLDYKNGPNPGWVEFKTGQTTFVVHSGPQNTNWKPVVNNIIITLIANDKARVMALHDALVAKGYKRVGPSVLNIGEFILQYCGTKEDISQKRFPEITVRDPFGHRINVRYIP